MDSGISYIYRLDLDVWEVFSPAYGSVKQEFQYVSTENQVLYSGNDTTGKPLAYDVGFIDVFVEGVKLVPDEFTATDGTSVSITAGVLIDKDVQIVATGTFSAADHYTMVEQDAIFDTKTDVTRSDATLNQIPVSKVVDGNLALSNTVNTLVQNQVTFLSTGTDNQVITTDIESYEAKYDVARVYDANGTNNTKYV